MQNRVQQAREVRLQVLAAQGDKEPRPLGRRIGHSSFSQDFEVVRLGRLGYALARGTVATTDGFISTLQFASPARTSYTVCR